MLLPYKEGLIITGNMCTIWLYNDTETRDSGWRAVTGYNLVRSATVSSDRLIHYFTEEHRGRPRWSQGPFKLCAAADLPQEGKGQKCAFFCVLICSGQRGVGDRTEGIHSILRWEASSSRGVSGPHCSSRPGTDCSDRAVVETAALCVTFSATEKSSTAAIAAQPRDKPALPAEARAFS